MTDEDSHFRLLGGVNRGEGKEGTRTEQVEKVQETRKGEHLEVREGAKE